MKDLTNLRHPRNPVYQRKRPSPHRDGISKSRCKPSPLQPLSHNRTPSAIKAEIFRQRQAQVQALRREGIFIEEEYREEICYYMHEMERYTAASTESMDQQPEIKWHMRPELVDFLVGIHFTLRLRPETLYLTLNIINRYVSRRIVYTKHYQLVGCAALWIAAKFEDAKERVPTVQDLVHICRETYDESAFIQMEGHVLATLQWTLGHPTAEAWLRLYCCGSFVEDTKVQHIARFLMEITLFYREYIGFSPSAVALASLVLARYTCSKPRRLYEESKECIEVVELLDERLSKHLSEISETLIKKYSFGFYSKASTHVVEWYLTGNRFVRQPLASLPPITPISSRSPLSSLSTPMSTMSMSSDSSSDDMMPVTPTSPTCSDDPFTSVYVSQPSPTTDKENRPMNFSVDPIMMAIPTKPVNGGVVFEDFGVQHTHNKSASYDILTNSTVFNRPALHELNGVAPGLPRHMIVS